MSSNEFNVRYLKNLTYYIQLKNFLYSDSDNVIHSMFV